MSWELADWQPLQPIEDVFLFFNYLLRICTAARPIYAIYCLGGLHRERGHEAITVGELQCIVMLGGKPQTQNIHTTYCNLYFYKNMHFSYSGENPTDSQLQLENTQPTTYSAISRPNRIAIVSWSWEGWFMHCCIVNIVNRATSLSPLVFSHCSPVLHQLEVAIVSLSSPFKNNCPICTTKQFTRWARKGHEVSEATQN